MIDHKKRLHHFETSTLLQLKLALIQAEKESPSRPPKEQKDVNEELALKLIASMKKKHKRFVFNSLSLKADFQENNSIKKVNVLEP